MQGKLVTILFLFLFSACGDADSGKMASQAGGGQGSGPGSSQRPALLGLFQVHVDPLNTEIIIEPLNAFPSLSQSEAANGLFGSYLEEGIPLSQVQLTNATTQIYDEGANEISLGGEGADCGLNVINNHSGGSHFTDLTMKFFNFSSGSITMLRGPESDGQGNYILDLGDIAYGESACRTFSIKNTDNTTYTLNLMLEGTVTENTPLEFISSVSPTVLLLGETVTINGSDLAPLGEPTVQIGGNTVQTLDSFSASKIEFTVTAAMASWEGEISVDRGASGVLSGPYIFSSSPLNFELQLEVGEGSWNGTIYFRVWGGYQQASSSGCSPGNLLDAEILNDTDLSELSSAFRKMNFLGVPGSNRKIYIGVDMNNNRVLDLGDLHFVSYDALVGQGKLNTLTSSAETLNRPIITDCNSTPLEEGCHYPPCLLPSGGGGGLFDDPSDVATNANDTNAIALGDLNGDGILDLVEVNTNAQLNYVYLGDGLGGFQAGTAIGTDAHNSTSLALGDLDNDGNLDLVVSNNGFPNLSRVYLGDGLGNFLAGADIVGSINAFDVELADLNGDGNLDFVSSGTLGFSTIVFLGDGLGGFGVGTPLVEDNSTLNIALGDLDNDGVLDLVEGNATINRNRVFLGDGLGGFGAGADVSAFNDDTYGLSLGDLNGDGSLDIAAGNRVFENHSFLGDGLGGFGPGSNITGDIYYTLDLQMADLNGDGNLDVITANSVNQKNRIYLGDGSGGFNPGYDLSDDTHNSVSAAIADLNGDGLLDVIIGNFGQRNRVHLGNTEDFPLLARSCADPPCTPPISTGNGTFNAGANTSADTQQTRSVALQDFDGDRNLDLIVGNAGEVNQIYLGDGAGGFAAGNNMTADVHDTRAVFIGDVNNDDNLDVVAGNANQANRLYLGDGLGGFAAGTNITADAHNTQAIFLADVNNDGNLDVIAGNANQANRIYLGDGLGGFAAGANITADAHDSRSVYLGHLNADANLDLVVGNFLQRNRVYLGDGLGGFGAGSDITTDSHRTNAVSLGDLNGDGNWDLVVGNSSGNGVRNRVYLGNGVGGFGAGSNITGDQHHTYAVALADVDGDNNLDFVAGNFNLANRVYLGDGVGGFASGSNIAADTNSTYGIALGDIDNDTVLDVVAGNNGQVNRRFLGN